MSGVSNNLKDNTFLYRILSSIDKEVFSAYNISYCTYENNEIFLIVLNDRDNDIDKYWSDIKSRCLESGVLLEYVLITDKRRVHEEFPRKLLESGYLSINGR